MSLSLCPRWRNKIYLFIYLYLFSVAAPFSQFIPTASCNGIPPLPMQVTTRARNTDHAKWRRETQSVTYAQGLSTLSNLHCLPASTVIPLLPKATFTPFIQPNLSLPCIRPPFTSAINTVLAIGYSSILSTCRNHLNTLLSALLPNFLSIQGIPNILLFN